MSKASIQAIFAASGILFTGAITSDAVAMATALQQGSKVALINFVKEHPHSRFAPDALMKLSDTSGVQFARNRDRNHERSHGSV